MTRLTSLRAVRLLLESEGMRIIPATSPAQALEVVRTQNVHAALVDLNFEQGRTSGEQGLDLVTRLTQTDAMLPITVMTAWSSIGLALEAMRRGAKDFVEKPFDEARLGCHAAWTSRTVSGPAPRRRA
jgi:FixJ family two-component response regulator